MKWADVSAVADAIEGWTDAQLACRANSQHSWPSWKGTLVAHRPGVYTIRQMCTRRCGIGREGDMDERGYMISKWRRIEPPKDKRYGMPAGAGRVGADGKALIRITGMLRSARIVEVDDE